MNNELLELLRQMSASLSNIEEGMNHISADLEELRGDKVGASLSGLYILAEDIERKVDSVEERCSEIYDECCKGSEE